MRFQLLIKNLISEHDVEQFVEAMRYMEEGRGFDFRYCHWNFSLT
jgi:hypothetical protein